MLAVCLALLYFLYGAKLFYASIETLGGPEGYKEVLSDHTNNPGVIYRAVFLYCILFWPILLAVSLIRYFAGRRRH